MGSQFFSRITIPHTHKKMKFLIALCLVASAIALEDTADVKAAKAAFMAAFNAAKVGAHAGLAPVQGPIVYLADSAHVAAAKPYLADSAAVAAAKPYLADSAAVAAAKPYLADSAAVAAAKPYLADSAH